MGMKNSVSNLSWDRIDERVLGKSWEREFPLMPGTLSSTGMANAGHQQGCFTARKYTGGCHQRSKEGYWRESTDATDAQAGSARRHNAGAEELRTRQDCPQGSTGIWGGEGHSQANAREGWTDGVTSHNKQPRCPACQGLHSHTKNNGKAQALTRLQTQRQQ